MKRLGLVALALFAPVALPAAAAYPTGTCHLATALCAQGGRFEVTVDFQGTPLGPSIPAHAVEVTADSGYFWFFAPENVEVVVKVLDGRSVNGAYWVFFGALSNVAYRVTVHDTLTAAVRTYDNRWGEMASVADTEAFPVSGDGAAAAVSPRSGVAGWRPIGPGWPDAAEVFSIAADPRDPNIAYVSYYDGLGSGVARTLDAGLTWSARVPTTEVGQLVVDSSAPDHVFLATVFGIWRSLDAGTTWTGPIDVVADSICASQGAIYAGTFEGVAVSSDLGDSWTTRPIPLSPGDSVGAVAVDPASPERLYAGTPMGDLWRSTDGGSTWTQTRSAPTHGVSAIAIDPFDHDVVYASTSYTGALPGSTWPPPTEFLRSVDAGRTWTELASPGFYALVVDPGAPGVLYAGGYYGGFRSADRGTSWTSIGPSQQVASLALSGSALYAGSFGGAFRLDVAGPASCDTDPLTLCLEGGRFRVRAAWQGSPDGPTVEARPIPLTRDTGAFWFFAPSNVELVVKVLDGRPVNGRFWVFVGGLSSVQYSIEVTDTETGEVWTHDHAPGRLESFADTSAF